MNSNTNNNNENWMSLDSNPAYEVSSLGNVRHTFKNNKTITLKPSSNGQKVNDYQFIILEGKKKYIHHLVLETFAGKAPKGYEADHKNRNKEDNSIENLRWLPMAENRSHKGQEHPQAKLNNEKVQMIRNLFKLEGINQKKIAQLFDLTQASISQVITRKSWSHV